MSIASRITSIENHIEEAYTEISRLGVDLTNVDKNIDNIADKLEEAYSQSPKVTDDGSNLSLTPTRKGGLSIIPKGACEQDSYSGKNKFGTSLTYSSSNLTIISAETNNFSYKTSWPATLVAKTNVAKIFKASTQYAISFRFKILSRPDSLGTSNHNRFFILYDTSTPSSTVIIAQDDRKNTGTLNTWYEYSNTFTTQSDLYNVVIYMYNYKDGNNATQGEIEIDNLQIEEGSTATSFEKYVGGIPSPNPDYPQDIRVVTGNNSVVVCNKNLLPLKAYPCSTTASYATATSSTEVTSPYTTPLNYRGVAFVGKVKAGVTYTFSSDISPINYTIIGIYKNLSDITTSSKQLEKIDGKTFTPNYDGYALICSTASTSGTSISWTYAQLEYGSTATTYVAHKEQTATLNLGNEYLAGIGNYKDKIVGKTDNWKIVRNIGKVVFNGSEDWSNYNNNILYTRGIYPAGASVTEAINGYCNQATTDTNDYILFSNNSKTAFGVKNVTTYWGLSEINTTEWKTYLSTNNVIVYYQLATPTETPITDQTLITDLNNMYQAMGYDGTTNIAITSNSANAQMEANISALKGE